MADLDVTFTDDIPKIEREGFTRDSKYNQLLDACVERPGKAAKLTVESQGQASSRASSIRDAATKHDAETDGRGVFVVATRSNGESFDVYTKFAETGTEDYTEEQSRRNGKSEKTETSAEEGDTPKPRPVKKVTKKATKKATKTATA